MKKHKTLQTKDSRAAKGTCKNLVIPLKDQTCESYVLKKDKKCKPKVYVIYSTIL
jgi:hypothetical protein